MNTLNFEYRVSPRGPERGSRFYLDTAASASLPKGAPVVATASNDGLGRREVELETGATNKPIPGRGGILDFELYRMDGFDPYSTTYSDPEVNVLAAGKPAQVVTGENRVKFVLRNTEDRVMVAGLGATPTVAIGDYLTPGTGNDTAGYWAETGTAGEGWLIVTDIDPDGNWVEVVVNF